MFSKTVAAAAIATLALVTPASAATWPQHATITPPSVTALDSGYSAAIHADVASSVYDPKLGKEIWVTGDVTQVQGTSTVGAFGYPHSAILEEAPGSTSFVPQTFNSEKFGTDYWGGNVVSASHYYQFAPNFSDGTYFWAAFPIYENGVVHVIGERIQGVVPFTVLGTYDVQLDAGTLMYKGENSVPSTSGDVWSGWVPVAGGYWFTSQHGNAAFIPVGQIDTLWAVKMNAVPATDGSWPVQAGSEFHLFATWYQQTPIVEYTAPTVTGPWSSPATIGQMSVPENDGGVLAHPDLPAPSGQILINWNENDSSKYDPQFLYVNR